MFWYYLWNVTHFRLHPTSEELVVIVCWFEMQSLYEDIHQLNTDNWCNHSLNDLFYVSRFNLFLSHRTNRLTSAGLLCFSHFFRLICLLELPMNAPQVWQIFMLLVSLLIHNQSLILLQEPVQWCVYRMHLVYSTALNKLSAHHLSKFFTSIKSLHSSQIYSFFLISNVNEPELYGILLPHLLHFLLFILSFVSWYLQQATSYMSHLAPL